MCCYATKHALLHHAGQISFTGGGAWDGGCNDRGGRAARGNESRPPDRVGVLGRLASYETVNGFWFTPVVVGSSRR